MKEFLTALTSRKFLFTLLVMLVALAVDMYTARGLSENFKQVLIYLVGIYTAGNVGTKLSYAYENTKLGAAEEVAGDPPVENTNKEIEEVKKSLQEINSVLNSVVTNSEATNKGLAFIVDTINRNTAGSNKG